jgi:hypothetical protein
LPAVPFPDGFRCTDDSSCTTCATLWGERLDPGSLVVTVDGHDVTALNTFHFRSAPFKFQIPKNNILGTGEAGSGTSVTDGYWLMLKPLEPGHHVIHFKGALYPAFGFGVDVTYELTVSE